MNIRGCLGKAWLLLWTMLLSLSTSAGADKAPVLIGLDAEFGHLTSTSDEAIKRGILIAIDEINQAGGVLGGRPLKLVERDNRSVPARANANLRELAAMPDMTAVFCGKFSPVVFEVLGTIHDLKLILLDPWAAADNIVDNGYKPNYVFRLSLRDSWALPVMMRHAAAKGARKVGVLLPNTSWGRSSLKAAEAHAAQHGPEIVGAAWYNWGDKSLVEKYQGLRNAGAQALILVANEGEGSILLKELAMLPREEQMPVVSHWGVSGGDFARMAGDALQSVDFSVVQTYSFIGAKRERVKRVLAGAQRLFGIEDTRQILSPVGVAHAYDLTHLLALAIDKAGTTSRPALRDALEKLPAYAGLIKDYRPPFSALRHEALSADEVFMARYDQGVLVRIESERKK